MMSAFNNFSTSSSIACCLSGAKFRLFCFTGFFFGSTSRLCIATDSSIPGMSSGPQAKTSAYSLSKWVNSCLNTVSKPVPIFICLFGWSGSIMTDSVSTAGSTLVCSCLLTNCWILASEFCSRKSEVSTINDSSLGFLGSRCFFLFSPRTKVTDFLLFSGSVSAMQSAWP